MSVYENTPYDQEAPVDWVRCLACNEVMERDWFHDFHDIECDGVMVEEI